jgi:leucyl aminopeptidase
MEEFVRRKSSNDAGKNRVMLWDGHTDPSDLGLSSKEVEHLSSGQKNELARPYVLNRLDHYVLVCVLQSKDSSPFALEKARKQGDEVQELLNKLKLEEVTLQSSLENSKVNFAFCEGFLLGNYSFHKYQKAGNKRSLATLLLDDVLNDEELEWLKAVVSATCVARDLVNEPLSHMDSVQYGERLQALGQTFGFSTQVLEKKQIESLKMGGLLGVNKGSLTPPTFSILEHKPQNPINDKPIVFVGKGVVFDTGGISLKPTAYMDTMKCDMGGSAAVAGVLAGAAQAGLPLHIIGLIPATDNRPGVEAIVPQDILTMSDGTTVEVLNTDAEGRLILADALVYAKKYDPQIAIELSTLTGSAAMAIGKYGIVAMGDASDEEWDRLNTSGENTWERLARFPFWEEYDELLESDFADIKNIGGPEGGAITAGRFLSKFTDYPFVHLDIAGPAYLKKKDSYRSKNGTGTGVRLLLDYLKGMS